MTQFVASQMIDPMAPFGPGSITGLLPTAISGTNTTAAVTVSAGAAVDSTNQRLLTLAAPYNWSVATDYQGGTTLPNSSTIHFFLCVGNSGARIWAHTGLVPTPPAGYNSLYRRAFSLTTGGTGSPNAYTAFEVEGGAMVAMLAVWVTDVSAATLTSANRTLYALSVPAGIKVTPLFRSVITVSSGTLVIMFTGPDEPDTAVAGYNFDMQQVASVTTSFTCSTERYFLTDTSGRIGARSNGAGGTFGISTRGFKDMRRG